MMGWGCFFQNLKMDNRLVCATCLPSLLCGFNSSSAYVKEASWPLRTYLALYSRGNIAALTAILRKGCLQDWALAGF